ncbi:hypothetical protein ZWY2020_039545 [Hordeum vulgare]|nr:hypothetical protein ZWY2020_039545 [Hordeum vulgare]
MILTSLTPNLHVVKVLAIESNGPNLEQLVGFLRCFPCLEKLYIKALIRSLLLHIRIGPMVDTVIHYNNHIKCLDLHLLEITLNSYRGSFPDIIFARLFVIRARVLKLMRFALHLSRKNEWFVDQRWQLHQNGKGSQKAKFSFGTSYDKVMGSHCLNPIHDFSVAGPFAKMTRFRN